MPAALPRYQLADAAVCLAPAPVPLAAASLGQVYRGVLRSSGEAVAVKVQRPGVAASIALDVYILRQARAAAVALRALLPLAEGMCSSGDFAEARSDSVPLAGGAKEHGGCSAAAHRASINLASALACACSCWRWCGACASSTPTCRRCWMSGPAACSAR